MDKIDTSKLENLLFQSIKKIHQQTLIIRHERLNLLASNLATSIIKKEANLDSKENRGGLIPDALRYEEINFVIPLKEPINDISINNNLVSYIKEKYIDIISSDINSIGTAIRVLPSNEILTVIIAAYLKQNVAPISMESVQQKTRPGKKTPPGGAWKNFSDSQNAWQGPQKNNYNKNHGAGNFKKSQHSPRQQQPRQQPPPDAASNNSKNIPWGIVSQALTQEQQQQRKSQQQTSNTYSAWKPQEPQKNDQVQSQQPSENSQQNVENEQAQQLHPIQINTIWHSFQPTEAFDDKNAYRKVPADMKRSHIRNNEQQKPQGRKPQNQKQRQQRNQQQQPQNQQPEKEVNQDQQEVQTIIAEIPVPSEVTENVPQQQIETEDNHSKWSEIRNILSYDDKNEFHKLPQEFRSSHSTTHTSKKETEKQRSPRRDKPQPKVSGNQQQRQKQQQQQPQQQPLNEPEKEVIGVPPRVSIWSAAVNEQTPYDDSHDVRKVPVQLRRSHHELELEDKKKKQNQKNQERKELKRQARNQKQANRNEKAQEQQQQQKQVVEEPIKSRAASAWANLNIAPPPPPPQQQQQLKSQRPQRMQKTQQAEEKVSPQAEPSQETVQQQQDENIVQKFPENEQPQAQEVVEQQQEPVQEKPLSAPMQSIWSSITIGMSDPKKPKQSTKPQQQPNQPETSPSEPPQEQAENIAFRSANLENSIEAEQHEVEKHEEEEEVVVEYKSLAPPAHIVNVWAGVQSIKKYDDSNDWRKTPTEFRRSHAPANVEQNKIKKSPRNQKKKNNEPQIQHQQRQQNEPEQQQQQQNEPEQQQQQQQNEPEQQQQQVDVQVQQMEQEKEQVQLPEEQNQEEPRPEAEKKPSWVNLEETPYDDKYDMRKIPPELRRTHNTQPIDKSKKDKRNKKDKDWSNDKKKGKDGDNRRNPLIQRPNPAQQPEPQSQPPEEEHIEVENEQEHKPVDPKKSIWSMAVPDTPYDDKYHLSKVPPQLRRTHKLNEEKARDAANKANREKESRSNRKRNNRNNQQNQNKNQNQDQNKNDEKQEEKAPIKNLSPWASFNIEPDQTKKVSNVQPQQEEEQEQQQPEAQQENEQQNQIEETDDVDNRIPEPEPQPEPELEPAVIDEPAPRPLKKDVHSAWLSVNLQSKP